jgi:hypothetical protein
MGLSPLPNYNITSPNIDVVGAQYRALQLKDLQNKASMFPTEQAAAQTKLESEKADLQIKQQAIKDQSIFSDSMRQAVSEGAAKGTPTTSTSGSIFQRASDLAVQGGASFGSVVSHQQAMADLRAKVATATKEETDNTDKQHENLRSIYETVAKVPPAPAGDQENEWNRQMDLIRRNPSSAAAYGVDPNNLPEYPGASHMQEQADILAASHNLHTEHTQALESEARSSQAATAASKEAREAGGTTPPSLTDIYKEKESNYRAELSRNVGFQNRLQQNGLSQLDKMFTDPIHGYTQFLAQAKVTQNTAANAKTGDELATSMAPLMTALGVVSFANIHRMNQTEVDSAGANVGSAGRRVMSYVYKMGAGKINPDTANEAIRLMDEMIEEKHQGLVQGASMIAKNNDLPPTTTVMDKDGNTATLGDMLDYYRPENTIHNGVDTYRYIGTGDRKDIKNYKKK